MTNFQSVVSPFNRFRCKRSRRSGLAGKRKAGSMRHWFRVAAVNILAIAFIVVAFDIALRFTPLDAARKNPAGYPDGYYVADNVLGATLARNFKSGYFEFRGPGHEIYTNALGCFDKPITLAENEPYILAIGDSFTWGYGPLESKWPSRLERALGIRVLKCGVSGSGSRFQLVRLKRLISELPHAPALVIQLYDTTDFNDDFTFPGFTILADQRIQSFSGIRLGDGERRPLTVDDQNRALQRLKILKAGFLASYSTLYNLARVMLTVDSRIERRRLIIEGVNKEKELSSKYAFNLLLLSDEEYPYVAQRFEDHLAELRKASAFAESLGAKYALFHTNSFRLPETLPLVKRLKAFFKTFPHFLGSMPELPRYRFDPHWAPESDAVVARVMLEHLKKKGLLPDSRLSRAAR